MPWFLPNHSSVIDKYVVSSISYSNIAIVMLLKTTFVANIIWCVFLWITFLRLITEENNWVKKHNAFNVYFQTTFLEVGINLLYHYQGMSFNCYNLHLALNNWMYV